MSRVIRGDGREGARVVPKVVYDAHADAARILREAQEQADRLTADATAESARIRESAVQAGEEAGRAEAAALIVRAGEIRDRALERAEGEILRIGMAVARRLVGEELAVHPERASSMVQKVLGRARRARHVVVRVHPDDVERVRTGTKPPSMGTTVEVRADASLTRGGCVVTTEVGELDARIETQLEAIERALMASGR